MWNAFSTRQKYGLWIGPLLFLLIYFSPAPEGLGREGVAVAAVALLMASFWIAETVPIPVTATFPIFLFPLLGVMPTQMVTASYGNHILFLFMGGFLIAVAMQRWHLHRRIALNVILLVGAGPERLILGFMLATAGLSMWISNSATAMMMMPVALAVIEQTKSNQGPELEAGENRFGAALMLGIAYSASIGGVATLVGTPPNAILMGIIDTLYGVQISFLDWMKVGVPVSLVMLVVCWAVLHFGFCRNQLPGDSLHRNAHEHIKSELDKMGPLSFEEKRVAVVFFLVACCWILRGLFQPAWLDFVTDPAIAMAGAFMLFVLPASKDRGGFVLDWKTAATIPWDIIILMGGGFALAAGFSESGLTQWLADQLTIFNGVAVFLVTIVVVVFIVFLTELTSNAATATLFIPVMGALAVSMGLDPYTLMVPVAIAASMAFMMPVATPPNAIVFASRQVNIGQMVAAGLLLNLLGSIVVSVLSYLLLPYLGTVF